MCNVLSRLVILLTVFGAGCRGDEMTDGLPDGVDRSAGCTAREPAECRPATARVPLDASAGEPVWTLEPVTRWEHWQPGLEINTLWLNRPHPWLPVVTSAGEERRVVLDVDNKGFDTARNVVVRVETGARLKATDVRSVYEGQKVECVEDEHALTCSLGDIPGGDTFHVRMDVTPLRDLRMVPVSVTSDTRHLIGERLNSATLAVN